MTFRNVPNDRQLVAICDRLAVFVFCKKIPFIQNGLDKDKKSMV